MTTTAGSNAELAAAVADAALLRGEFTLRSGRKSSYYLDKFRLLTRPALLERVGQGLADRVQAVEADLPDGPVDRIGGAVLGGVPLASVVSLKLDRQSLFIRDAKKGYGTSNQIEGVFEPSQRVILVEDVATTAGAALEATAALREAGLKVEAIVCVIDREEGARANVESAGLRFEALLTKTDLGINE